MSDGRDRVVVNCGTSTGSTADILRATAAHSTLIIENMNSAEVRQGGGLGRRPMRIESSRNEQNGNIWVSGSHDGYRERFGFVHQRRLYLSASGDNLRGEDTLVPTTSTDTGPRLFVIRFHLHPDVQASPLQNSPAILLRLPSGIGWRFQCTATPYLEESAYFGDGARPQRSQQIVAAATALSTGALVKWAFRRL